MSIRLATSCGTCSSFTAAHMCSTHEVKVSDVYVCDQFSGDTETTKKIDCISCARHQQNDCKHPDIATHGVLCTSWAPKF